MFGGQVAATEKHECITSSITEIYVLLLTHFACVSGISEIANALRGVICVP